MSAFTARTRVTAHFRVNTPKGKSEVVITVEGAGHVTGKQLKDAIAKEVGFRPESFRVIFDQGVVEDRRTLASQGICGEACDVYCPMHLAWHMVMTPYRG